MTGQRLPRAYRSRPRPSSALSAKASTVCPCSLDQKNTGYRCRYGVFKVHADRSALREKPADGSAGLSKLNSVRDIEVDVILGVLGVLTACAIEGPSAYHHEMAVSLERR
jgi:hypothetical protein